MFDKHPGYRRFGWVGNRISDSDMVKLYKRKIKTKKPISVQVAEAVTQYLEIKGDKKRNRKIS